MTDIHSLATYDYQLPDELIADHPVSPRDAAKLLVWPQNEHKIFSDLADLLQSGDVLVVNSSKVIPARLRGIRPARDAQSPDVAVEVLLHRPRGDFSSWIAFAKPTKRLRDGDIIQFDKGVAATVTGRDDAQILLQFNLAPEQMDAFLDEQGDVPLPPYIARPIDNTDKSEYQTVYVDANAPGSVAAPTAGLHFTDMLLQKLRDKGIEIVQVTLHVGAGTFLPVTVDDIREHKMHAEWGRLTKDAADKIKLAKARGGRVIAVGTTATRVLETAANQPNGFGAWEGDTDIFITPGYAFRMVDILITNFHLPKSTLLMLVSAFLGGVPEMRGLYKAAIENRYRFYSYGDACLLTRG